MEIAIFDQDLMEVDKWRMPTPTDSYTDFIDAVTSLVRAADKKYDCTETAVGIGIAGIVDAQGKSFSGNIPCISGHQLSKDLSQLLNRPVIIENDMKTFTLSEAVGGSEDGCGIVLGVIVGTGVGCGVSVNGQLLRGFCGIAGEWGHAPLSAVLAEKFQLPLRPCGCGGQGCSELYIAGPALLWLANQHYGGKFNDSVAVITAARTGDVIASKAFDTYLECLGGTLAQAVLNYDPEVIVLGGGMSNVPELFERLPEFIGRYLLPNVRVPKLVPPQFGDSSGVRGAALLGAQVSEGGSLGKSDH